MRLMKQATFVYKIERYYSTSDISNLKKEKFNYFVFVFPDIIVVISSRGVKR